VSEFEIRLVASPTRGSFGQVALFVHSLRALGYSPSNAFVKVFLGASCDEEIDALWHEPPSDLEVIWADRESVRLNGFYAQCDASFAHQDFRAELVVYCDTDTIWLQRIDEVLERLARSRDTIAGVMAHYPPPWKRYEGGDGAQWSALGRAILGSPLVSDCAYSIRHDLAAPFYPNYGFVAMQSRIMETKGLDYLALASRTEEFLKAKYFKYQLAVPLLCEKYNIETISLPPVYNFINDAAYEALYQTLVPDVKVIHYLRHDHYDRTRVFSEASAFREFLDVKRSGIDFVLQERVRHLWSDTPPHLAAPTREGVR
jgi:hypothetical protein